MIKNDTLVKVVDIGENYPTYAKMVKLMELNSYEHNESPSKGGIYKTITKSYHHRTGEVVYAIEDVETGQQYIMREGGIKPIANDPIVYHFRTKNLTKGGFTVYFKDGKVGIARCSMDDNFCKYTGYSLAMDNSIISTAKCDVVPKKHELFRMMNPEFFNEQQTAQWKQFLKEYHKDGK